MLLSVIIVSYNTKELTLQTIKSVEETIKKSSLLNKKTEIIVVDNNSKDNSKAAFKRNSSILLIANKTNLGFATANNDGVVKSKGKYIIFLNSDTIVQAHALENMVKRFEENEKTANLNSKKLGVLSPILLNKDLTLQSQGGSFPSLTSLFFHMTMLDDLPLIGKYLPSTQHTGKSTRLAIKDLEKGKKIIEINWVGGTAMMIPRAALDEFGSLDPNIFMYGEDVELCLRAHNHHYAVAIDPTAQVIHLQNKSSSTQNAIRGEFKGYDFIYAKHYGSGKREIARTLLQIGAILRIFVFKTISKNTEKVKIYHAVLQDLNNARE